MWEARYERNMKLAGRMFSQGACQDQTCGEDLFSRGVFKDKSFVEDVFSRGAFKDKA